ncbi:MAG: hypothetical protein JXB13_05400, partial [Phycisphaerae bacterium]|nr:hypothetical protein [Phycisphaerae bacterium]
RIEHSLYKSMNELQKLRLMRELEPSAEKTSRRDNRWGKPQPACATHEAALEAGGAGGEEAVRQTKPIGREKCWGTAEPASASERPARACRAGENAFSGPVSRAPGGIVRNEANVRQGKAATGGCL